MFYSLQIDLLAVNLYHTFALYQLRSGPSLDWSDPQYGLQGCLKVHVDSNFYGPLVSRCSQQDPEKEDSWDLHSEKDSQTGVTGVVFHTQTLQTNEHSWWTVSTLELATF